IAYLGQTKLLRENKKLRNDDHLNVQRGLANGLLFKVAIIYSYFGQTYHHMESSLAAIESTKGDRTKEPWEVVRAFANLPAPVTFSSEEMGMLLSLREDELFNLLFPLDGQHGALLDILNLLNQERTQLFAQIPYLEFEDGNVRFSLDNQQTLALRPSMTLVNELTMTAYDWSRRDFESSQRALIELQRAFTEKLGMKYELKLVEVAERRIQSGSFEPENHADGASS
ncbi:MAG: hypothetical protein WD005_02500, partial [Haliea sp.]